MGQPSLLITATDLERIRAAMLMATPGQSEAVELLDEELCRSTIVEPCDVPSDVVTMNSRVEIEELDSGRVRELTLVYPRDGNADAGHISVLAPLGSALLGLRAGQTIEWPLPGNRKRVVRVLRVCYQPEAAGKYDL